MSSAGRATSLERAVIHDEPDVVALHGVAGGEFPMGAKTNGPPIRQGGADLGSDPEITIAVGIPVGLLIQLPNCESGDAEFDGIATQPDHLADTPIDDHVVSRRDAG